MAVFQNAHNFSVSNPVFVHHDIVFQSGRTGIDILRESSAQGAAFDSSSRQYAPSCFPGTRSQYIEDIANWSTGLSALPMYLMTGPAGVGKSAIAQTCAEKLRCQGQLGASFFFTTYGCSDHSCLFTTIAYQLSTEFADYREHLNRKLYSDPTLVGKRLQSQFKELIGDPFRELEQAGKHVDCKVILIDGLDECKDKEAQREIIEIVAASIHDRTTPFYWAFFCRPEPHIEAAFTDPVVASICNSILLPVSRGIDGEIELYLQNGFENILRRRGITTSVPWPSEQDMRGLVSATQGLFIYAATVLRFVEQRKTQHDPQELLRMVLRNSSPGPDGIPTGTPFEALDKFYTLILKRIPDELQSSIQLFLSFMAFDNVDGVSPVGMRLLSNALGFAEVKAKMLRGELAAVVCYRPSKFANQNFGSEEAAPSQSTPAMQMLMRDEMHGREGWLNFYHKSFLDFLSTPSRSGPICVFSERIRHMLFQRLIDVQIRQFKGDNSKNKDNRGSGVSCSEVTNDLSWAFDSEPMNSNLRDVVSEHTGDILIDGFFQYDDLDAQLIRMFGDMDHRRYLLTRSRVFAPKTLVKSSTFGFGSTTKNIQGVMLSSASRLDMLHFDAAKFRSGISRLEEAKVIQRYMPGSTTLELPLFRYDSNGDLLSGLYTRGHGQKSTFWYWSLDPRMRYYREFEAIDLVEGEQVFQGEDFQAWGEEHGVEINEREGHGRTSSSADGPLLERPELIHSIFYSAYSFCRSILFSLCKR